MKVLDLCSGIGGFSIGLEKAGMETIAFCEIDEFCEKVLKKHWPNVPIAGDLKKLSFNCKTMQLWYKTKVIYVGTIDLICGGYPCQPFSVAGKRGATLISTIRRPDLWPTPRAAMTGAATPARLNDKNINLETAVAKEMFATPTRRDYKSGAFSPEAKAKRDLHSRGKPLNEQVGGQLNPQWVEWLMGYPDGWTGLERSETP